MIHLRGHTALITGATQGVGQSIAIACAEAGANVIVHGKERQAGAETVAQCRALGVQSEYFSHDLVGEYPATAQQVLQQALALHADIDLLVNNAGTYIDKPFLEMDWATYYTTMQLNVAAPYFLTQAFAQHWLQHGIKGRVLLIGSINGQLAEPTHTCYDTSKGAVLAMLKSLCVTLAPLGIRVNGLAPGLVRTPLTNVLNNDLRLLRWMQLHTPNQTVPDSSVCGGAAVYLLSDAATHVHGQMLLVDGGMSAWQQPDIPDTWQ
jgi:glucose 1-dehydrogenase